MKIFSIYGGRTAFWQWDLGQRLIVSDDTCSEVHFDNGTTEKAPVCKVKEENGLRLVDVPNIFLQSDRQLKVYAFVKDETGQYTEHAEIFEVLQKLKPDDYVYTETEILTWEALDQRITSLEEDDSAILCTPQSLNPEQQTQARENIGVDDAILEALVSLGIAPVLLDADGAVLCDNNAILVNG